MHKAKNKHTILLKLGRHTKHIFVPHKGNDYRPHLIRASGLTIVLVIIIVMQLGYGLISQGKVGVLGRQSNITISDLVSDTNKQRQIANLKPLALSDKLNQAAFLKAKDMFNNQYWAHTSPAGVTPWKWLTDVGYDYGAAGENLAKNFNDADSTVAAWMASPTHRANILNSQYSQVGFAVADGVLSGQNTTLVVAYYGLPASAATQNSPQQYVSSLGGGASGPLTNFGVAIRSLSPATLGTLALLTVVIFVSAAAHHYRYLLPKQFKTGWRRHHGAYKMAAACLLALIIIVASGGGQI